MLLKQHNTMVQNSNSPTDIRDYYHVVEAKTSNNVPKPGTESFDDFSEDLCDSLHAMRFQEKQVFKNINYLSIMQSAVNEEGREVLVHWFYKIIDVFNESRDLAILCTNIFDRFLQRVVENSGPDFVDVHFYRLAALTCLYVSIKLHGTKKLKIEDAASLCQNQFSANDIADMEGMILRALKWKVSNPTSSDFAKHLVQIIEHQASMNGFLVKSGLEDQALYNVELSAIDYETSGNFFPSTIAIASVLVALRGRYLWVESLIANDIFRDDPLCVSSIREACDRISRLQIMSKRRVQ